MNILRKFPDSAKETKNIRCLTVCALMLALRVVLGYFSNISLSITPNAKIGFAFLPVAIVAALYGPVWGLVVGGLGDVLSFMLMPMGNYFFGWTLNAMLVGMVYGLFLYKNNSKLLLKLILCEIVIGFVIEVPLGSLWLLIQFGKSFWLMAGTRAIKWLIAIPIETALVYLFTKMILPRIPFLKLKKN
ncbi:MAG: folate family ECF transporter S component [Eubacteriales bacterium]|nr:folate family ECF transporter S component [Eubacteriales bacterium]